MINQYSFFIAVLLFFFSCFSKSYALPSEEVQQILGRVGLIRSLNRPIDEMSTLDLSNQKLNGLDLQKVLNEIDSFPNLVELKLQNNQLGSLPNQLKSLKKLQTVILYKTNIKIFPTVLFQLPQLRDLDLSNNNIESIPSAIGQLKNLRNLDLSNNKITFLPAEIGHLYQLESLFLQNNRLTTLPIDVSRSKIPLIDIRDNLFIDFFELRQKLGTTQYQVNKQKNSYKLIRTDINRTAQDLAFLKLPETLLNCTSFSVDFEKFSNENIPFIHSCIIESPRKMSPRSSSPLIKLSEFGKEEIAKFKEKYKEVSKKDKFILESSRTLELSGTQRIHDPLELISMDYVFNNKYYGQENIERINTIQSCTKGLKSELRYLDALSHQQNLSSSYRSQIKNRLIYDAQEKNHLGMKQIAFKNNFDQRSEGWLTSSYFRELLQTVHQDIEVNPSLDYRNVMETAYLSLPVNFRYQSYTDPSGKKLVGFFRLGVISDHSNGWTNLRELKSLKTKNIDEINSIVRNRVQQIQSEVGYIKNPRIHLSSSYAISEFPIITDQKNAQQVIKHIDHIVEKRRNILSNQMLYLVAQQVSVNIEQVHQLKSNQPFPIFHLSLINQNARGTDPSGWRKDEGNEMLDMAEIFREFQNRTVYLENNCEGPYFDLNGEIHLPTEGKIEPKTFKLFPVFANMSVYSNKDPNNNIQFQINLDATEDLFQILSYKIDHMYFYPLMQKIRYLFLQPVTNYRTAMSVIEFIQMQNIPFSIGCLSAKDRTGFLASRIIIEEVSKIIQSNVETYQIDKEESEEALYYFNHLVLDKTSAATLVVKNNTSAEFLKLAATELPGISKRERIKYYFIQAKGWIQEIPILKK